MLVLALACTSPPPEVPGATSKVPSMSVDLPASDAREEQAPEKPQPEVQTPEAGTGAAMRDIDDADILARSDHDLADEELLLVANGVVPEESEEDEELLRPVALLSRATGATRGRLLRELEVDAWADDYSVHFARLRPGLYDVRVNVHHGEDDWYTDVDAAVLLVGEGGADVREIWSGTESYSGVLDICVSEDGVNFEVEGDRVWRVMFSRQTYAPREPGDRQRVSKRDCPPKPLTEERVMLWPEEGASPDAESKPADGAFSSTR